MASVVQVCLALLLLSCVHGQGPSYLNSLTAQCSDGTAVNRVANCSLTFLSTLGISSSSPPDVATIYSALCNNIPALTTFYGCLRNTLGTCLATEFLDLLPSEARARDAFQYYCDHRNEINEACASTALASDSCAVNAGRTYQTAITDAGLVRATCSFMDALRGCAFSAGASCPSHNRDVYDTYLAKTYPSACGGGARSVPTSFLLLGACAILLNKMAAAFLF